MTVYDSVKKCCDEEGISIRALEEKVGLGNGTVGKWKERSPSLKSFLKVADYFEKPIDYFVVR